jgi:succinate dehydrogenase flavin-adding protein (antitoxin of CptAB toxin-antitoxin module)
MELKMLELSRSLEVNSNENLALKSETKQLHVEISMNKDKIQMQCMQLTQLTEKIKSLETIKEKLEDEKSQLYEQIHLLLQQNQELLTQLMANKDMHNEETKSYLNQVNNLKRQKEILEQKVMEHYKNSPSQSLKQKSKKSFSSIINNSPNNNTNSICSSANTNSNANQGLIRQLVQKVRNKSSSSSSQSSSSSACSTTSSSSSSSATPPIQGSNSEINALFNKNNMYTQPQLISYTSDLTDHDSELSLNNNQQTFCHKYSADDINHLNIKEKVASSSSAVSSPFSSPSQSQSQSINPTKPMTPTTVFTPPKQQQVAYIVNRSNTPLKIDPKSLKLGRTIQPSLSSSSSPIPRNSPIFKPQQQQQQHQRTLFATSSPKANIIQVKNSQSPT